MRRGERIACAQAFSVPERLARPHHAFEEQFKRMAAVVRRQLDGARPRRLADILPLLHERLGLRLVQRRLEVALRPAPPEMRRRERSGQLRLARETVPFDMPDTCKRTCCTCREIARFLSCVGNGQRRDHRKRKPQESFCLRHVTLPPSSYPFGFVFQSTRNSPAPKRAAPTTERNGTAQPPVRSASAPMPHPEKSTLA